MFILNPHSSVPIYQQLIEQVRRLVTSGQLAPGAELPSVREMAQEHTVHPMTISKAVAALRKNQLSVAARLKQIEPQMDALALSVRQLELDEKEVMDLLKKKLGEDK
jgi:GntR family transcriptional regulator